MKPVRCSWVDMQKIRQALSEGERGDQKRLEKLRCVDQSTVSDWKATCDLLDLIEGRHGISHVSAFQPSHAKELARVYRKRHGKKIGKWPEGVRDEVIEWIERVEKENLTVNDLRRLLRDNNLSPRPEAPGEACTVEELGTLVNDGETFGVVYADPPWQYDNQGTRAATDNHYDTMTIEEIAALPVARLAAERSLLFLWTTGVFLPESFRIVEAWGFEYRTYVVWCKPQIGIGNYFRKSTELLLLGVRGELGFPFPVGKDWFVIDRTEHSAKPEEFRKLIESVSPTPRLELFGRRLRDGWTVWGNQIERSMFDTDAKEK